MQPVLSLQSASLLDKSLIERYHLSEGDLIDNAARLVFENSRDLIHGRIAIIAGPGNNGSDGLSLALILIENGYQPDIYCVYEKGNSENLRRRKLVPPHLMKSGRAAGYDTLFDAVFGFSFHGEPDQAMLDAREDAESADTVISIDVPSAGIIDADRTIVLMAQKSVLYEPGMRGRAGEIILANPGFPESELSESPDGIFLLSDSDSRIKGFGISDYKNTRVMWQ